MTKGLIRSAAAIGVLAVLAATIFACQHAGRITRFDRLTLHRSRCFGTCPEYRVSITGDGTVDYEGGWYVAKEGRARAQLSHEQMQEIVRALNDVKFLSFKEQYAELSDGCPGYHTDAATVTMRIEIGGLAKGVRHYHGCVTGTLSQMYPFPLALTALEDRVDAIAGSERWVGHVQNHVPVALVLPGGRSEW